MKLFLYSIFLVFSCTNIFAAQDSIIAKDRELRYETEEALSPVAFDKEQIKSYKNDRAFDYMNQVEDDSWWTRFKKWVDLKFQQLVDWLFGDYKAHSAIVFILSILPYLILGAVAAFIIWLFIRLNPGASILNDPKKPEVYFSEEEEIIHSKDISELIEMAINNGEYRLAVRYYYLQLLKQLNEAEIINYEYQKTNAEYLAEINEEHIKAPLKRIMRLYDFIWYGNFPVTPEDFSRVQESFRSLGSSLKPAGNG